MPRDQVGERRVARLEVEIGHAVDRRAVPVVGPRVGDAGQSGSRLRDRAAQRPLQDSVADEVDFFGAGPVIVERVARELFRPRRIERDVEQVGAIAIGAEHVGRDEARAGEIALVAQDAVELERMADRFVDLQDHLVGRQQHVHRAARAVRRSEQFQRLLRDPAAGADEAETGQDLDATLLANPAIAVERAVLGHAIRVRRDRHSRHQEPVPLDDVAAGAGHQSMRGGAYFDARFPIDDARVAAGRARFLVQQVVPFAARRDRVGEGRRCELAARRRRTATTGCRPTRGAPWRAPIAQRAQEPRRDLRQTYRRSPRSRIRHRRRRWPSRRDRSTRHTASQRSCARRSFRCARRRSATTRNRRERRTRVGDRRASGIRNQESEDRNQESEGRCAARRPCTAISSAISIIP